MATRTTALSMMNRLRRLHRFEDVTTFADELSKVLLDLLNEAMRDVLEGYRHTFDERSDLTFKTFPAVSGSTAAMVANTTQAAIFSYTGEWIGKGAPSPERFYDATMYMAVTGDATYGNTAFRVTDGWLATATDLRLNLEMPWTGANGSNLAYRLFAFEYALPATVRSVVSVRDQNGDIRLHQAMSVWQMEGIVPNLLDGIGGEPSCAIVTGYRTPTALTTDASNTGASSSNADYSLALYPVPADGRAINVTYLYRHPELTDESSVLDGVPLHMVDTIVMVAHAKAKQTIEKDYAAGAAMLDRIAAGFARKASAERPDPFRRRVARSLDSVGGSSFIGGRLPRPFVDS